MNSGVSANGALKECQKDFGSFLRIVGFFDFVLPVEVFLGHSVLELDLENFVKICLRDVFVGAGSPIFAREILFEAGVFNFVLKCDTASTAPLEETPEARVAGSSWAKATLGHAVAEETSGLSVVKTLLDKEIPDFFSSITA